MPVSEYCTVRVLYQMKLPGTELLYIGSGAMYLGE